MSKQPLKFGLFMANQNAGSLKEYKRNLEIILGTFSLIIKAKPNKKESSIDQVKQNLQVLIKEAL